MPFRKLKPRGRMFVDPQRKHRRRTKRSTCRRWLVFLRQRNPCQPTWQEADDGGFCSAFVLSCFDRHGCLPIVDPSIEEYGAPLFVGWLRACGPCHLLPSCVNGPSAGDLVAVYPRRGEHVFILCKGRPVDR